MTFKNTLTNELFFNGFNFIQETVGNTSIYLHYIFIFTKILYNY